ncbi:pentatricopeptide repeat-containing protein [Trypanosoma rangeli]|uniref:Pentatricopeptide repeat-containing protein n=1 Tax=Trypanosoma rangeli TaxID=5698 RepID=A0A422NTN1_TRYRA|nr:pentatricopeptide repeat-containing protein [Trypanosoma rangeli]RNF08821.1 pentatricopeptide repeat-containing protein [Trypanosoma rangeli]|eukprot:RNF08821.1 pentatricopeptide repeat-containing protein [Trypanosoma rangeli]
MLATARRLPKALSPYAQALKHVALRGTVAFGPSAKEMELDMYRKGTLPPDYRPPVQGKWDDTIERWAYAWQFPAEEEQEDIVGAVERNSSGMQALLNFGNRLLQSPPSTQPHSGKCSKVYPPITGVLNNELVELLPPSSSYEHLEQAVSELITYSDTESTSHGAMTAAELAARVNVPVAYIDDSSEVSNASKELAGILEDFGLEYTEEGLIIVISALSRQQYTSMSRAVFDFACAVGLGPSAELYKALMRHASRSGDVNASMALIEEMKAKGITPRIGNWHELMRAFHQAKDYPAVIQIVDNMKMYANIEPNEVTFAIQLKALAKDSSQLNSLAESIQLFDQMENVYGFIASRPHYDVMMYHLSQSPKPEMRLRCEELAHKMELMGIVWNATTYLNLIRSAQVVGDIAAVERYLSKMRDDGVVVGITHLSWAIQAHVQSIIRIDYAAMREKAEDPLPLWLEHLETCFGIYNLVVRRGWTMQLPFVNALLRLCCQATILAMEHTPDQTTTIGRFEEQSNKIWNQTFEEWHLKKDVYSYECYIALLAHQQRIDEAEKLFQEMVLKEDLTPSRRTYDCLIFMHLSSGEEGGTARALRYLEAMERAGIQIRPSFLKKIVRVNNAAGYKRDMKRRARRIMQAREEYLARKEHNYGFNEEPPSTSPVDVGAEGNPVLTPLPISASSTLAWWENWKRETTSKHELFSEESADGTPKGENFEEKNDALKKLGIISAFPTKDYLQRLDRQKLLPQIRSEEGEVTGSLWAMDGGEFSYPKDGGGPQGWGIRLWRERQVVKREHQKILDGAESVPPLSALGNAARTADIQLDIERSGAQTPGELSDYRQYPDHRFDTGALKPILETAADVPISGELVWQGESRDKLSPYKSDEEIALENDNTFFSELSEDAKEKMNAAVKAIRMKEENTLDIKGKGVTRRSKYDYLEKWREMYRHGTLEVPEGPTLRFGRTSEDHKDTMASLVREWYQRNKKKPGTLDDIERWERDSQREKEASVSRRALKKRNRVRRHHKEA